MPSSESTSDVAADQFSESFTGSHYNQAAFGVVGNAKCLVPEDAGLRITISPPDTENAGLRLPQQLIGDFVITASVSLLEVPKPAGGHGTGMTILLEDGIDRGASLQRVVMTDGRQVYVTHNYVVTDGKHEHKADIKTTTATSAVLQLERKGATLIYRVSEDAGKSFVELHSVNFTLNPIPMTQIYGQTGGAANPLSVRLESLTVEADELVRPGQKSKIQDRGKLLIIIVISLAVLTTAILLIRRRSRNRNSEE
ncbi:MAG: DUF1583 domain-containing protein [Planctomycetaceae bacterium]